MNTRIHAYRKGFTLIELLVVIAIISILASILFPVFARARENARRSSCQSNLKQIGLSIMQYTQDYDEKYFGHRNYGSPYRSCSAGYAAWATFIEPYMKNWQIFNCPSHGTVYAGGCTAQGSMSYGISYRSLYYVGEEFGTPYGGITEPCTANCGVSLHYLNSATSTAAVEDASGTIHVTDAFGTTFTSGYDVVSPGDGTGEYAQRISVRHLDTVNILFVDGHVKSMKKSAVVGPGKVQWRHWTTSLD